MESLIDIVGHFGTTFSYATVASRVARALREEGLLGTVSNLDPAWHAAHDDLRDAKSSAWHTYLGAQSSHVALFTAPNHYVDVYADMYGRERSAIFMSPNTDSLAPEHAGTCARFGLALVPSEWCRTVVETSVPEVTTALLPLGVDLPYVASGRQDRRDRIAGGNCRVLHLSSDHVWPGRKGTQELLQAWAMMQKMAPAARLPTLSLTLHVPPALRTSAERIVRHLELRDVTILVGGDRGDEGELLSLLDAADLLVAPSRCEGFGMMFLAALVAGVPLACTYNTGHVDFLSEHAGWLGVPSHGAERLYGEEGLAPVVDVPTLAATLLVAVQPEVRALMMDTSGQMDPGWGTWGIALKTWMSCLREWVEETSG